MAAFLPLMTGLSYPTVRLPSWRCKGSGMLVPIVYRPWLKKMCMWMGTNCPRAAMLLKISQDSIRILTTGQIPKFSDQSDF